MNCAHCGHANPSDARFCRNCGQPLIIIPSGAPVQQSVQSTQPLYAPAHQPPPAGAAPAHAPAHQPSPAAAPVAKVNSIEFWINEATRYGWRLWPVALLVIYIVWTKNVVVLVIGIAITWAIRRFSPDIDKFLTPVWPYRNLIPVELRKILGYVVPIAISLLIGISPRVWPLLGWLPIVGASASLTIFTALIAASAAYILVREPSHAEPSHAHAR